MNTLLLLIPILIPILIPSAILYGLIQYWQRQKRRSPFTENLLRPPGYTLGKQLDDLRIDILGYYSIAIFGPLLIYSIHLSQSYFLSVAETAFRIALSIISVVGLSGYASLRLVRKLKEYRRKKLGYEAELATGQYVEELRSHGCAVYHDLPMGKFNIDHVIVGPHGVFTVETKGRRKPNRQKGAVDAKVCRDGDSLIFPDWVDSRTTQQARDQTMQFNRWISSATGDTISSKPIVALPGWFVESKQKSSDLFVINPKQLVRTVTALHMSLSDDHLKRINHQIKQLCGDVEIGSNTCSKPD